MALCFDECISKSSADDQVIYFIKKVINDTDFIFNLCSANDRSERTFRMLSMLFREPQVLFPSGIRQLLEDVLRLLQLKHALGEQLQKHRSHTHLQVLQILLQVQDHFSFRQDRNGHFQEAGHRLQLILAISALTVSP